MMVLSHCIRVSGRSGDGSLALRELALLL